MSIEAVITQTLSTWPGLLGVLVRPDKAELSDTAPILVVQKITGQRVQSLTGDSGLAHDIFQFDVYASTRLAAVALIRFKLGVMPVIVGCALVGLACRLAGWA